MYVIYNIELKRYFIDFNDDKVLWGICTMRVLNKQELKNTAKKLIDIGIDTSTLRSELVDD